MQASGFPQSSGNLDHMELQQFQAICNSVERCQQHLRMLRQMVSNTHDYLSSQFYSITADNRSLNEYKERIEKASKEMTDGYDKLEAEAKQLPAQMPPFTMANKLNNFLLDCATTANSEEAYNNTRDAFNWSETTANYVNYVSEFLKPSAYNRERARRLTIVDQLSRHSRDTVQPIPRALPSENPQRQFEKILDAYFASPVPIKGVISIQQDGRTFQLNGVYRRRFLERSALNCVFELKLFTLKSKDYETVDRQDVCLLKMLFVVNHGVFEYVQFVAPHEDWTYIDATSSRKQIDLSRESRYDIYQRLTAQGNILVHQFSLMPGLAHISQLLNAMARLQIMEQSCRYCKKVMRDFSPPALLYNFNQRQCFHLTCR